jgi:hypothetical protein
MRFYVVLAVFFMVLALVLAEDKPAKRCQRRHLTFDNNNEKSSITYQSAELNKDSKAHHSSNNEVSSIQVAAEKVSNDATSRVIAGLESMILAVSMYLIYIALG